MFVQIQLEKFKGKTDTKRFVFVLSPLNPHIFSVCFTVQTKEASEVFLDTSACLGFQKYSQANKQTRKDRWMHHFINYKKPCIKKKGKYL